MSYKFNLTDDQKEALRNFGALGYNAYQSAAILFIPNDLIDQFVIQFNDPSSEIHMLYRQGYWASEYIIDQKLLELSQNGDVNALKQLNLRKTNRKNLT